ncbi:MAG TPA: hypothetical protein VGT99_04010, partial [Gammaproteobacteria bacterium]|nr:hypothetical protein [Gammaproteobacteria bacterium]
MRALIKILQYAAVAAVVTVVYSFCNYLDLYLKLYYSGLAPLWPAAGIGTALLWLYGLRWWPV